MIEEDGPPVLLDANKDIFRVCMLAVTQARTGGMGGVIGLDYGVIFELADIYGITVNIGVLEKIRQFEYAFLSWANREVKDKKYGNQS